MSELAELLEHALNIGDPWRRIDGTRPPHRGHGSIVRVPKRAANGEMYAHRGGAKTTAGKARATEVVVPTTMGDDYSAIVTYDAASARRMARRGFRRMEFERGELPPGVKVWVKGAR